MLYFRYNSWSNRNKYIYDDRFKILENNEIASVDTIGKIRYRLDGNASYYEMVMQTGATAYSWVAIKTNTW